MSLQVYTLPVMTAVIGGECNLRIRSILIINMPHICIQDGCTKRAIYGYETYEYCREHKLEDMENLVSKHTKCISV